MTILDSKELGIARFAVAFLAAGVVNKDQVSLGTVLTAYSLADLRHDGLNSFDETKFEDMTAIVAKLAAQAEWIRRAKFALEELVSTVDGMGGVTTIEGGHVVPVDDEDWIDLGSAYQEACSVLDRSMKLINKEE